MNNYSTDFNALMQANTDAFDAMGNIRREAEQRGSSELHKNLETAFSNVALMAREYTKMYPQHRDLLSEKFSSAYINASYVVDQVQAMINSGQQESEEFKKLLSDKYDKGIFRLIDSLGPEFEEKKEGLNIQAVTNLHELIRYLHQKTIEMTFDAKKLKDNTSGLSCFVLNRGTFYFMDLDNQIDGKTVNNRKQILCRPAEAILDFYGKNIHTVARETFYMFLRKDCINAHVKINCHSAEIDARLNGDNSFVRIRYNEYLNDNYRGRIDYLSKAMEHLCFDVKVASKIDGEYQTVCTDSIVAEKTSVDEQSAYATLTELVRLLASSTHINCSLKRNTKYSTEDLLKVFFDGEYTDLYDDLFENYTGKKSEAEKKLRQLPKLKEIVSERLQKLKISK